MFDLILGYASLHTLYREPGWIAGVSVSQGNAPGVGGVARPDPSLMRMKVATHSALLLLLVSGTLNCHPDTPSEKSAQQNAATQPVESVPASIRIGEQRVFDPSGPKFKVDDFLYRRVTSNPETSKPLLEEKLRSTDAAVRCNAYDFIAHFLDIPEEREWAMRLLRAALMLADGEPMPRSFLPCH